MASWCFVHYMPLAISTKTLKSIGKRDFVASTSNSFLLGLSPGLQVRSAEKAFSPDDAWLKFQQKWIWGGSHEISFLVHVPRWKHPTYIMIITTVNDERYKRWFRVRYYLWQGENTSNKLTSESWNLFFKKLFLLVTECDDLIEERPTVPILVFYFYL